MLALDLALDGITVGAIAALSGLGLLITYRATGVFNLAHGGIAMVTAYLMWQLVRVWDVPVPVAAALCLLVFAPGLGVLVERLVFRALQHRQASPAESLVATLGLLVLLIGVASVVWGTAAKTDSPSLFPTGRLLLAGTAIGYDTVAEIGVLLAVTVLLAYVANRTYLGTQVRAVVNRRDLAELAGVDADRVSAMGWAVGAAFAGLTGVLLAPHLSLNPYGLTLVVLETFAVPVIARLYSLGAAVLAGLTIGVAQAEVVQVAGGDTLRSIVGALHANGFVVALFVALLLLSRLREVGSGDVGATGIFATRSVTDVPAGRRVAQYAGAVALLCLPLLFGRLELREAMDVPALAVVFLSLVAVTGYSGQMSLGQAGFAGLGALFYAKAAQGDVFGLPAAPDLLALLLGVVCAGLIGFATGYPAIRRRGLFLALTTFAVGVMVSRFVFQEPSFTSGVSVHRPQVGPWSTRGDHSYYLFELACLALVLLLVHNLRTGRLGRALVAMRDSEDGARAAGIDIGVLKVYIFAVSASVAGLGGALYAGAHVAFEARTFDPLQGLFWLTAVVVFGADSAAGAVAAAAFIVAVDTVVHVDASTVAIGVLALLLGRLPGGAVDALRRLARRLVSPEPPMAPRSQARAPAVGPPRLSAAGRALRARVRAR